MGTYWHILNIQHYYCYCCCHYTILISKGNKLTKHHLSTLMKERDGEWDIYFHYHKGKHNTVLSLSLSKDYSKFLHIWLLKPYLTLASGNVTQYVQMALRAIKHALCIILWCLSWTHIFWVHVFVLFQILVKCWRNLFPISWPFITNPKRLQHYLQTDWQEALRIRSIIYLLRSSVKLVLWLHRRRWRSGEKVDKVLYWATEWEKFLFI